MQCVCPYRKKAVASIPAIGLIEIKIRKKTNLDYFHYFLHDSLHQTQNGLFIFKNKKKSQPHYVDCSRVLMKMVAVRDTKQINKCTNPSVSLTIILHLQFT